MPKRTSDFRQRLLEGLRERSEAVHYLNAAHEDSMESFLRALRDVCEARRIAEIAETTSLNRENLYKILSEKGNPTLRTLTSILEAMGIEIVFREIGHPIGAASNFERSMQASTARSVEPSQLATSRLSTLQEELKTGVSQRSSGGLVLK
jgi:probable addiction module antidote protein